MGSRQDDGLEWIQRKTKVHTDDGHQFPRTKLIVGAEWYTKSPFLKYREVAPVPFRLSSITNRVDSGPGVRYGVEYLQLRGVA